MDVGVVLQTNPPAWRVVDLAKKAEVLGFTHVWTFDSHLLWEEPFVIFSQILAETRKVIVGPMVTNPATRDWTVTASLFATLNEMYGNRTICGIGRGDSAVRVTNGAPTTLATLRDAVHVIRELANGREVEHNGSHLRFPWGTSSRLEVWIAAYGPKALALTGEIADGFILQLADPDVTAWSIAAVRKAATEAGRDPAGVKICVAAPAYVGSDLAHMRDQCRWFGGMVGNHVADIVARYGDAGGAVPKALTDYISGRQEYDYNEHGKVGNVHTAFVPDEIVDRFCILGTAQQHITRLEELKSMGVDQFSIYLQHDGKERTLEAYGETIIPAVAEKVTAEIVKPSWRVILRKTVMFVLAFALIALIWEGYKAVGPEKGGEIPILDWKLLPRTSDTAMPHTWDMVSTLNDTEVRGNPRTVLDSVAAATWYSLRLSVFALALGAAVGLGLAIVMARSRLFERATMPYLVASQIVPLIALSPVLVSWLSHWDPMGNDIPLWITAALLGAFLAFFPIAVAGTRGLTAVNAESLELLDSYAASWRQGLRKVRLPSAVPLLMPALKLAAANAVIGVLVSEISIGLRGGIGRLILEYYRGATGNTTRVYAAVFGAATLGFAMAALVALVDWSLTRHRTPVVAGS